MRGEDLIYLGIGALSMAKERLDELAKDLEKRGEMSKEEWSKFMDEAVARGREATGESTDPKDYLRDRVREVVKEMGLATRKDIEELKELLRNKGD